MLEVQPVLVLQAARSRFVWVHDGADRRSSVVPSGDADISVHLQETLSRAKQLKTAVASRLGSAKLAPRAVEAHYHAPLTFDAFPGIRELRATKSGAYDAIVVTGEKTHFITPDTTWGACPYHQHTAALAVGRDLDGGAITSPKCDPRSYFTDASSFHCAHQEVDMMKALPLSEQLRQRSGPRSNGDDGAFCELWTLDQRFCCRMCVYRGVCMSHEFFQLPCHIDRSAASNRNTRVCQIPELQTSQRQIYPRRSELKRVLPDKCQTKRRDNPDNE